MRIDPQDGENLDPLGRELSRMLDQWDPIGVYSDPDFIAPTGEYRDLVRPILARLAEGCTAAELGRDLVDVLQADYGLAVDAEEARRQGEIFLLWSLERDL